MPGLDITQISSNWKKLQVQLKGDQQDAGTALKRKRNALAPGDHTRKRRAVILDPRRKVKSGYKMGNLTSHDNGDTKTSQGQHSALQTQFDVSAKDISAAYGQASQPDTAAEINGGRHPFNKAGRYLALDCEMVGTGPPPHSDDLLARVSIVNFHGRQIYDSYVLPIPGSRVEDYRTHVSGIRREHLRPGVARSFVEVQRDVSDLLKGKILVGHALRKDMQALQLNHPKPEIRDTSRYPAFRIESRGKPPALRHLAKTHLGMEIQKGEHSSVEDARATMMLYKKEKTGFEAENRKQYGVVRQPKVKQSVAANGTAEAGEPSDEDDYDSEDDRILLENEEDDDIVDQATESPRKTTQSKKRRKKKKRTKR